MKLKDDHIKSLDLIELEKLVQIVSDRHGVDARSKRRDENHVALRSAILMIGKSVYPNLRHVELAHAINRDHATISHMLTEIENYTTKSKIGMLYQLWITKIMAIHPLVRMQDQIKCRALLGYL